MTAAIRFAPFTEADFHAWLIEAIPSFALTNVEDGRWTLAESIEKSKEAHAAFARDALELDERRPRVAEAARRFVDLDVVDVGLEHAALG